MVIWQKFETRLKGIILLTVLLNFISVYGLANPANKLMACPSPYIKYTNVPPVIDGNVDAIWANAELGTLDYVVHGSVQPDFAGTQWRVLYDENYLYVLAEVKDEHRVNDSGTDWWEDDAVEIFIDGDNSRNDTYDGVNDFQFAFRYNDPTVNLGENSVTNTTGVEFVQYEWSDGNGYTIEARIPWSTIGITPAPGNFIGFEIEIDDDEDGDGREAQMSGFITDPIAYQKPSLFTPALLCADPIVTINQSSGQSDPTNSFPITFDVVFSHDVTGFTFGDIDWTSGTATGVTGSITAINGAEYKVTITNTSEGTLIANLPANSVQDSYGNWNEASASTDNSVTFDVTKPGIEILLEDGQTNPSNSDVVSFKANFTEQVVGFVPSDVALSGSAGANTVNLRGGPLNYTIDVSGMTNDGTITVSIAEGLLNDAAGNFNTQSVNTQNTVMYDNTKPNVVISSTVISPTNLLQIPVTVEFSSEVSGFEAGDINSTNCIISVFNETIANQQWELVLEPVTDGTIVLQIPANVAVDNAGNGNNASNNFSIEYVSGNNAPLIENQIFSIDERSESGTLVGRAIASDPDNDALTFSILSGNDGSAFTIDAETGDIAVNSDEALNYFTTPVFTLLVNVEDDQAEPLSAQAEVTVNLNEVIHFEANNIFVPNSQTNRYWKIKEAGRYADYELTIRNVEGRIVYQTTNYQNDWNGTYNNKQLPAGTYYYFLQNGANLFKGFINIIYK